MSITKRNKINDKARGDWPWSSKLDAEVAAPDSHRILLKNKFIRLSLVSIKPGMKEPVHTHQHPSLMLIYQRAGINYYDRNGHRVFSTQSTTKINQKAIVEWLRPEPPHAIENIGTVSYEAIRVGIKDGMMIPLLKKVFGAKSKE